MPAQIHGEESHRSTIGAAPLGSPDPLGSHRGASLADLDTVWPCPETPASGLTHRSIVPLALAAAAVLLLGAWLFWLCRLNPKVSFLPEYSPAHWIVQARGLTAGVHDTMETAATFRRTFGLESPPSSAILSLRAFKAGALVVNGEAVALPAHNQNWKRAVQVELAPWLRSGDNTISITVSNQAAPPALWLALTGPGLRLISDASWEVLAAGSWQAARLASGAPEAAPGDLLAGQEKTLRSLAGAWPELLFLTMLSASLAFGARWFFRGCSSSERQRSAGCSWRNDPALILFAVIAVLQICLLAHNLARIPHGAGFDAYSHLDYVEYIQSHAGLPSAGQGWEMHQPPLYYLVCAATLNAFGLSAANDHGVALLRCGSLIIGLVHTGLILALLRLLFPKQPAKQTVGLAMAGFVPMQLYLAHYPTNESLAACLMAASLYLALRLMRQDSPTLRFSDCAALGLYTGLALLTKVTALVIVPFALIALVYSCRKPELTKKQRVLFPLGAAGVFLAVCGWHYGSVWRHFGTPFFPVTHWAYGISWWQDPGYRTSGYFLNFGRSLTNPFFSGISSFADGLYSTLWGDGLGGGAGVLRERPPWNYQLMATGFVLALLPTCLIGVGLLKRLWQLLRRHEPGWLLLVTFSFAMLLALLYLNLMVPSYAVAKSFYGLGALGAACAFAASGWELLEKSKRLSMAAGIALTTWALVAYLSFWAPASTLKSQTSQTPHISNQLARTRDRL